MNFPARPLIIKLMDPELQAEFERQRLELQINSGGVPLTNEMFVAYMIDIRKKALELEWARKAEHGLVDEHAMELLGHDDPKPKGEVN
jgi:hypothetical protein